MMTIKYRDETIDVTVTASGTNSSVFYMEDWVTFMGAYFPAMDNGAIGLEVSPDGVSYYPVLDPGDGQDAVLCASGSDPGFVDFTDLVRFLPDNMKIRFTCAAQSSGGVTIKVYRRG